MNSVQNDMACWQIDATSLAFPSVPLICAELRPVGSILLLLQAFISTSFWFPRWKTAESSALQPKLLGFCQISTILISAYPSAELLQDMKFQVICLQSSLHHVRGPHLHRAGRVLITLRISKLWVTILICFCREITHKFHESNLRNICLGRKAFSLLLSFDAQLDASFC